MKKIFTENAPKPIGPFSQALEANGLVFLSGQVAINPITGQMTGDNVQEQTKQVFENISNVLTEADLSFKDIVKTTVFLKDMNDFQEMNKVYATYFGNHAPARSAIEVARLPLNAIVEIECIAIRK